MFHPDPGSATESQGTRAPSSRTSAAPHTWAAGHAGAKRPSGALLSHFLQRGCKAQNITPAGNSDRSPSRAALRLKAPCKFWQLGQPDFYHLFTLMYLAITQKGF